MRKKVNEIVDVKFKTKQKQKLVSETLWLFNKTMHCINYSNSYEYVFVYNVCLL